MPRRSRSRRGGGGSSRSAPRPVKVKDAPAPANSGSGGSVLGDVAKGMAFGIGASVAHRVVDSMFRPRTMHHETVSSAPAPAPALAANSLAGDACNLQTKAFQDCVNSYGNDISKCQSYMDKLVECRKNTGATLSA